MKKKLKGDVTNMKKIILAAISIIGIVGIVAIIRHKGDNLED